MQNSNCYSTSEQAEEAFYLAFQRGDIEMMMSVWSIDKDTTCVHPGGPRLEGRKDIRESWEQIFAHERGIKFEINHKRVLVENDIAIHHVIEAISVNNELQSEIVATNVYCKTKNGWHMILHHASPELLSSINQPYFEDTDNIQTIH